MYGIWARNLALEKSLRNCEMEKPVHWGILKHISTHISYNLDIDRKVMLFHTYIKQ